MLRVGEAEVVLSEAYAAYDGRVVIKASCLVGERSVASG